MTIKLHDSFISRQNLAANVRDSAAICRVISQPLVHFIKLQNSEKSQATVDEEEAERKVQDSFANENIL
jgi:hypothetical protein